MGRVGYQQHLMLTSQIFKWKYWQLASFSEYDVDYSLAELRTEELRVLATKHSDYSRSVQTRCLSTQCPHYIHTYII